MSLEIKPEAETSTLVTRALEWWRERRDQWRQLDELHHLSPNEFDRIAGDFGMSSVDFLKIACMPEGVPQLLRRRLEALHLTPEEINLLSPLMLSDLKRTCNECPDKAYCASDMAKNPLAAGWEKYCPNSPVLTTLGH